MKIFDNPVNGSTTKKELLKHFPQATIHQFARGDVIVKERHNSNSCFYVVKGRVLILKKVKKQQQVKLGVLSAGQFFGEMAMLSGKRRSATVTAMSNVEAVEIGREEFIRLSQKNNNLAGTLALHFSIQMSNRINRLLKLLSRLNEVAPRKEAVDIRQVLHDVYSTWAV